MTFLSILQLQSKNFYTNFIAYAWNSSYVFLYGINEHLIKVL